MQLRGKRVMESLEEGLYGEQSPRALNPLTAHVISLTVKFRLLPVRWLPSWAPVSEHGERVFT